MQPIGTVVYQESNIGKDDGTPRTQHMTPVLDRSAALENEVM